jgi:hypothetical protein
VEHDRVSEVYKPGTKVLRDKFESEYAPGAEGAAQKAVVEAMLDLMPKQVRCHTALRAPRHQFVMQLHLTRHAARSLWMC